MVGKTTSLVWRPGYPNSNSLHWVDGRLPPHLELWHLLLARKTFWPGSRMPLDCVPKVCCDFMMLLTRMRWLSSETREWSSMRRHFVRTGFCSALDFAPPDCGGALGLSRDDLQWGLNDAHPSRRGFQPFGFSCTFPLCKSFIEGFSEPQQGRDAFCVPFTLFLSSHSSFGCHVRRA